MWKMHRGDCCRYHNFIIILILFNKIIWGHEVNHNEQQNLEYIDPEDDMPTSKNETFFTGNVNIKSLFNIPTNFSPIAQQQQLYTNQKPNANTTNTPILTTYPLLLQHLHSTNAFVGETRPDLSISSSSSSSSASMLLPSGVSLTSNQEYQMEKQEKTNDQIRVPLSNAKVQQAPSSKQKLHKTDAPMLNYIFDSHAPSKKHNHNFRFGPHFEEVTPGNATNVTMQHGGTAFLDCKISFLQDKTVSWVRRKHQSNELQLLTVGLVTYTGDSRYTIDFQYPNNWRLKIAYVNKRDEGSYECQISTHPPKVVQTNLFINAPEIMIVDEHDDPLFDKYYEIDSTLQLTCIVRHVTMIESAVYWTHNEYLLNYDTIRGGISVKTDLTESGANSTLFVAKVNKSDSGNYTCSIGPTEMFTTIVHVLNESLAELYHGNCRKQFQHYNYNNNPTMYILILWIIKIIFCYTICDGN